MFASSTPARVTTTVALLGLLSGACASSSPSPPAPVVATPVAATTPPAPAPPAPASVAPSAAGSVAPSAGPSGSFDPANFSASVDNAWYPLKPGTKLVYKGVRDGEPAVDTVTVTGDT